MRNTVTSVIELLIGAVLIGLGLLYLSSQYRALSRLTDTIAQETIEDSNIFGQYNNITSSQITDDEVYATIMGYREYPMMVDENIIPVNGQDYEMYFTYIKDGQYIKEYQYDENRNIVMIYFSYTGA